MIKTLGLSALVAYIYSITMVTSFALIGANHAKDVKEAILLVVILGMVNITSFAVFMWAALAEQRNDKV